MTREELKKAMRDTKKEVVIKNLHKLLSLVEGYPEYEDCVGYAIEALEQEPILDKIRAEIMALRNIRAEVFDIDSDVFDDRVILRSDILKILDKYTAETEADND